MNNMVIHEMYPSTLPEGLGLVTYPLPSVMSPTESVQVRPDLHEGRGLGLCGCASAGVGQEGRRLDQ